MGMCLLTGGVKVGSASAALAGTGCALGVGYAGDSATVCLVPVKLVPRRNEYWIFGFFCYLRLRFWFDWLSIAGHCIDSHFFAADWLAEKRCCLRLIRTRRTHLERLLLQITAMVRVQP